MATKKQQLLGRCMLCDEVVSKEGMTAHLERCLEQQPQPDRGAYRSEKRNRKQFSSTDQLRSVPSASVIPHDSPCPAPA